jgi:pimeloyl-[acyl-carrier protein] methyl ester esterase
MIKTIVLLRGLSRQSGHWAGFDTKLRDATGLNVVAIDLPGFGDRSHVRAPLSVYETAKNVKDLIAAQQLTDVCVLGISFGGMVAIEIGRQWPLMARSLVVVNSSVAGLVPAWKRLSWTATRAFMLAGLTRDPQKREKIILGLISNLPVEQGLLEDWAKIQSKQPADLVATISQLLAAIIYKPRERPAIPMTVMASERDRLASMACSQQLAYEWNCPIFINQDAGHDLAIDAPDWTIDILQREVL